MAPPKEPPASRQMPRNRNSTSLLPCASPPRWQNGHHLGLSPAHRCQAPSEASSTSRCLSCINHARTTPSRIWSGQWQMDALDQPYSSRPMAGPSVVLAPFLGSDDSHSPSTIRSPAQLESQPDILAWHPGLFWAALPGSHQCTTSNTSSFEASQGPQAGSAGLIVTSAMSSIHALASIAPSHHSSPPVLIGSHSIIGFQAVSRIWVASDLLLAQYCAMTPLGTAQLDP